MRSGDYVIVNQPRAEVVRHLISHMIHHRGQLSVYLRLLDVPVPYIYGPTADETSQPE
ncbi:DinB family protein [Hymenobacter cellulosilyticus]|uniref:DinB family protein n=1 Tax=Hymenobacter cellulosilyticus TaxID=2932248 RepID=A0A8T9Q504_9BACT|nr:DinB family protein [Hymenobacter cellulosilyticus]UOQ71511.1 DinB family protein [Hymenobacter cellulosilyticus]